MAYPKAVEIKQPIVSDHLNRKRFRQVFTYEDFTVVFIGIPFLLAQLLSWIYRNQIFPLN
jgi:hypothetical protein